MYRTHRAGKDVTCHIRPISCSACECGVSSASALRHDCAVNPTGCYQDNQWRDIAVYFRPSPRSGVLHSSFTYLSIVPEARQWPDQCWHLFPNHHLPRSVFAACCCSC